MAQHIPYSLLNGDLNSDRFYSGLSDFTDQMLCFTETVLGKYIDDYQYFVIRQKTEKQRSSGEYFLESMMIGVYWLNYSGKASSSGYIGKRVLAGLYSARKRFPEYKNQIDRVRTMLAYKVLENNKETDMDLRISTFRKLLAWLEACGEFHQEVKRLKNWASFLEAKNPEYTERFFDACIYSARYFSESGEKALGNYCSGLDAFQSAGLSAYKSREDYFLAARKANEYYLNMFGAEILNRELAEDFSKTSKKVLLLPTCMRTEPESGCKALSDGKERVCATCSKDCKIGSIARAMKPQGVVTYLIPHSTDFSRFLVKWKGRSDVSLIGVACVLNLLTGGYEMKNLEISSQCVFLDFCGCKKHWHPEGIPTDLNLNRLKSIVDQKDAVLKNAC